MLAMHDLALVNPRRIRVGTRRRARPTLPPTVELVTHNVPDHDVTTYEGIPSTTVARAIADCRGHVTTERLLDGVDEAERRGLLRRDQADELRAELVR